MDDSVSETNSKTKSASGAATPRAESEQVTFRLSQDLTSLLDAMAFSRGLSRHVLAREIVLKRLEAAPGEASLESIQDSTKRVEELLSEMTQLVAAGRELGEQQAGQSATAALADKIATIHGDLVEAVGVISGNQKYLAERLSEKHEAISQQIERLSEDMSTTLMLLLVRDRPLTIEVARRLVVEKLHH